MLSVRQPWALLSKRTSRVEVICDEIEGYNDTSADLIYDQLEHLLFEGHALGHSTLGQHDTIRAYTHQQLMAFRQRLYQPERAVFFAYGDISFARLVRLLSKAHGCPMPVLTAGGTVAVDALLPPPPFFAQLPVLPAYNPRHEAEDKDTHQCHVILGTRAYGLNHPRRMTLALVTNLLGGPGMSARLNLSLRERHALVYTVESFFITYSDTGVWGVYFGCDPHDVSRCRRRASRGPIPLCPRKAHRGGVALATFLSLVNQLLSEGCLSHILHTCNGMVTFL